MADFPLERFQRIAAPAMLISQLQAAWALLSPAVQEAEKLRIESLSDFAVAQIMSFPVSGGAVPAPAPPSGQLIVVQEVTGAGPAVGAPVSGAADSSLLVTDSSGDLASGPPTSSVVTVSSGTPTAGQVPVFTGSGNTTTPGAGAAATALIPKLHVAGHSIAAADPVTYDSHGDGIIGKLAMLLGARENNYGVDSAGMMSDNSQAWGHFAATGSWVNFVQNVVQPARTRAPYLSPLAVVELMWGINDIAQYGPANANFVAVWKMVLTALAARGRLGALYEDNDASVTYGSGWSTATQTTKNSGAGLHFTGTNGSSFTVTVPADYDGQGVVFCFLATNSYTGTMTATIGATPVGNVSGAAAAALSLGVVVPFVLRLPAGTPGLVPGATITITASAISTFVFFDWWGIEANPAPLVILADCLRPPTPNYGAYSGWPYTPTDADLLAVNAANATVAALFSDGMVITDGADALINKGGGWLVYVHPDERSCGKIAALHASLARAALTPAILSELDTTSPTARVLPSTQQPGNYTLALADAETCVEGTSASAQTFTLPPNVFAVGDTGEVFQDGAGQITIAAGGGVTLRSDGAKVKTAAQYSTIGWRCRAINEFVLSGDLA